jgi:hypothetical protein
MAAISVEARDAAYHLIMKRKKNWAAREAGVVVVFCVVFIVATGLLSLCISRALARRRAARGS